MLVLIFSILFGAPIQAHAQMDLLTIKELGQLDNRARIYYLETYQEMMGDLEKFQKKFETSKKKSAMYVSPQERLWSLIFESAHASYIFTRGQSRADRCVWAGNLQTYSGPGRCNAPVCSNSSGSVQCSLLGTGTSECLPGGLSLNSTIECARRAKQCASNNSQAIGDLLAKDTSQVSTDTLTKYACDPRVMSVLVQRVAQQGTQGLSGATKSEFELYDIARSGVNSVVNAFQSHCSAQLDQSVINGLSGSARTQANQMMKEGRNPTVADVLQPAECQQLNSRVAELQTKFNTVAAQIPNRPKPEAVAKTAPEGKPAAVGAPVELQPGLAKPATAAAPAVGAPVELVPKAPPVTVTTNNKPTELVPSSVPLPNVPPITPTGPVGKLMNNEGGDGTALANTSCIRPPEEQSMLSNRGMACVACLADRNGGYGSEGVSTKWLSLLATIGHICGRPLNATESLYFAQAVGHCSAQNYKWEPGLSEADRQLARDWQTGRNLNKMDSRNGSSGNASAFTRVYGIDKTAVANVFCDSFKSNYSGRFANDPASLWVQRVQSMSGLDYNKARSGTVENQLYKDDFRKLTNPPLIDSSAIHKCLVQAQKNKTQLNLADGGKQCSLAGGMTLSSVETVVSKMERQQSVMSVNSNNPNECWVSLAASKYTRGEKMVTFANPLKPLSAPIQEGSEYNRINYSSTKGSNPINAINVLSMASPDYCTQQQQVQGNYIQPKGAPTPVQREVRPPTTPVQFGN